MCEENRLVIGGTIFKHKDIHKLTWTSPDGRTQNQIDHIIINSKWRTSLQDVIAKRGADIGSDHTLVTGKIKLKLRKARKKSQREPPINIARLKEQEIRKAFQTEVKNRFAVLQDQQELDLYTFNKALIEVGNNILGPRRKRKEEWISERTWKNRRKERSRKYSRQNLID